MSIASPYKARTDLQCLLNGTNLFSNYKSKFSPILYMLPFEPEFKIFKFLDLLFASDSISLAKSSQQCPWAAYTLADLKFLLLDHLPLSLSAGHKV